MSGGTESREEADLWDFGSIILKIAGWSIKDQTKCTRDQSTGRSRVHFVVNRYI